MRITLQSLKSWASDLKRDVLALWIAARSPETPWLAKLGAGAVAAYAFSPIDLIPDFIPVLGYLDDLVLVPVGIALVVRLIPPSLMTRFRAEAALKTGRPRSYVALAAIVLLWFGAAAAGIWWWRA